MASVDKTIRIYLKMHNELSKEAEKATNSLKKMGDSLTSIGKKMTVGITAPLVAMGAGMMKAFSDFETVMTEISARTGATGEELKKMSDLALKMGLDTRFSAKEAAQALLELTSSGQSAAQAMKTLKPVLDLAAAGSIDLGRAADGVTDIMAQFQLEVREAAAVADILAKAAGSSSSTVESLLQGFANVGPVANTFGLSVADTAAALAVLSENGIKAAEGGTALKSMLLNMSRDTDVVRGQWEKLGLSMYDAQGNMRNIDDLFKDINKAMEDMTIEEQNILAQNLAGSYGIMAFNSLRASNGISTMRDSMNAATGAQETAVKMSTTLAAKWEQFMGSLETLGIVLGGMVAGPLGDFVTWLTQVVNGFTAWAQANPAMAQTLMIILAIVAAIGPLLVIIGQVIGAIVAIKAAFLALSGIGAIIAGVFAAPIVALGLFIAAVAFAVAAILGNWFGLRDALVNSVGTIVNAVSQVGDAFKGVGSMVAQGWENVYHSVGTTLAQIAQIVGITLGRLAVIGLAIGKEIIGGLIKGFSHAMIQFIALVQQKVQEVNNAIKKAFGIASPSKVMMKIGEQVVAGFHEGIQNMGGVGVNVPNTSGSIQSRQPSLAVAGASGGGSTINNYFQAAPGTSEQQAEEIYRMFTKKLGKEAARKGAKPTR